ncbi:MAG: hypothetical protein R3F40_17775 [Candidatus Competibacteraceae bacterium]
MTDQCVANSMMNTNETVTQERRNPLRGQGKWSQAVIGGVLLGGAVTLAPQARAGAWVNRREAVTAAAGSTAAAVAVGSTAAVALGQLPWWLWRQLDQPPVVRFRQPREIAELTTACFLPETSSGNSGETDMTDQ